MLETTIDLARKGFHVTVFTNHMGQFTVRLQKFISMNPNNCAHHVLHESMINEQMVVNSMKMLEQKLNDDGC